MPRSSRRCRSLSDGSMTAKRLLSKSKCRSIRGSVPRPIEPKPIITIGPLMRPCTGQVVIAGVLLRRVVGWAASAFPARAAHIVEHLCRSTGRLASGRASPAADEPLQRSPIGRGDRKAAVARPDAAGLAAAVEDAIGLIAKLVRRAGRIPGAVDAPRGLAGAHLGPVRVEGLEDAVHGGEDEGLRARELEHGAVTAAGRGLLRRQHAE